MTRPVCAPNPRPQGGFMLFEVLVALLLFSFCLLGIVAMHTRVISSSIDAQNRNRAALLANEMVSSMWLSGVNMTDCSAWETRVADTQAAGLPGGRCKVELQGKTTKITIYWKAPANDQESNYTTTVVLP